MGHRSARRAAAVPGGGTVTATTDSVLRFYAVWWAAQGPRAWRIAARPGPERPELQSLCIAVFLGRIARVLAWRSGGPPHLLFQILMVAELTGAPALLLWQRSLIARSGPHGRPADRR